MGGRIPLTWGMPTLLLSQIGMCSSIGSGEPARSKTQPGDEPPTPVDYHPGAPAAKQGPAKPGITRIELFPFKPRPVLSGRVRTPCFGITARGPLAGANNLAALPLATAIAGPFGGPLPPQPPLGDSPLTV